MAPDRHQHASADVRVLGHHEAAQVSFAEGREPVQVERAAHLGVHLEPQTQDEPVVVQQDQGRLVRAQRAGRDARRGNDGGLPRVAAEDARFGARLDVEDGGVLALEGLRGEHAPHERAVLGDRDAVHAGELRGVHSEHLHGTGAGQLEVLQARVDDGELAREGRHRARHRRRR